MLLTKFVTKERIVLDLNARNKSDAIETLARTCLRGRRSASLDGALDQLLAREALESTGIGQGIAVPHARVPGLRDLVCTIGRVDDGLDFHAIDRKPVYLIFLACYPPARQTTYLNFIATLARLLHDGAHLKDLLAAETSEQMFTILDELSARLFKPEERYAREMKAKDEELIGQGAPRALVLLARLELCTEMLDTVRRGKEEVRERIDTIRSLLDPRILSHYERLKNARGTALVALEGGTCEGCRMKLPTLIAQDMLRNRHHLHLCPNCQRFIYIA